MDSFRVRFACLVGSLFLFVQQVAAGHFVDSCKRLDVWEDTRDSSGRMWYLNLTAECKRDDGGWQKTTLDLDPYIGNDNGRMVWAKE
jgi:hypothetical protein